MSDMSDVRGACGGCGFWRERFDPETGERLAARTCDRVVVTKQRLGDLEVGSVVEIEVAKVLRLRYEPLVTAEWFGCRYWRSLEAIEDLWEEAS
jgi:hypothetical protein